MVVFLIVNVLPHLLQPLDFNYTITLSPGPGPAERRVEPEPGDADSVGLVGSSVSNKRSPGGVVILSSGTGLWTRMKQTAIKARMKAPSESQKASCTARFKPSFPICARSEERRVGKECRSR